MRFLIVLTAVALAACSTDEVPDPDVGSNVETDAAPSNVTTTDVGMQLSADASTSLDSGGVAPDMRAVADAGGSQDMGAGDGGDDADVSIGPAGCPDGYEPNNVVADASSVTSGMVVSAANCGFDDDDVFALEVTAGQTITLVHRFANSMGNLDLNLHAPSQAGDVGKNGSFVAFTFAFEDEETLTHVAEETGTYYILSFNNNESNNPYTLSIDVQ